jgi:hypothetical protein
MKTTLRLFALFAAWALAAPASMATNDTHFTARRLPNPPRLDGQLEDLWQTARTGRPFSEVPSGKPAGIQTETFIGFDDQALYIAFHCQEPDMPGLVAGVRDHDGAEIWRDDCVEVFLDIGHSRATYCHFILNARGTKLDQACKGGSGPTPAAAYLTWNPRWTAAVGTTSNGWTAEMRIPFAELGVEKNTPRQWGINLCRERRDKLFSQLVPTRFFHAPVEFGILDVPFDGKKLPAPVFPAPPGKSREVCSMLTNKFFVLEFTDRGVWSLKARDGSRAALRLVYPEVKLAEKTLDLSQFSVRHAQNRLTNALGEFDAITIFYTKPAEPELAYQLWFDRNRPEIRVRLDIANRTAQACQVETVAPLVCLDFQPGGAKEDWKMVTTAHAMESSHQVGGLQPAKMDSHLALRNRAAQSSFLLGFLAHRRGLGQVALEAAPNSGLALRAMTRHQVPLPAGKVIQGEPLWIAFGRTGVDDLERFGELIAQEHGIALRAAHPLSDANAWAHTLWNGFGAYILVHPLGYNTSQAGGGGDIAELRKLGLDKYGYLTSQEPNARHPAPRQGSVKFMGRNQGRPDPWSDFKQEEFDQWQKEHPDWFVCGHMDFSHPAVIAKQREFVKSGTDTDILNYGADFVHDWRHCEHQHDPSQTATMMFRNTLQAIREMHAQPWGSVWINNPPQGYGLWEIVRIGTDSDRGYIDAEFGFLDVCVPMCAHRFFYNGQVWWNNPDSFHVYAMGRYSPGEARVHASFCAFAANILHLGEPLALMAETNLPLPADRLEIIKKVSPAGMDTARPLDFFESSHPAVWHMPIRRSFGAWDLVGLFAYVQGELKKFQVDFTELGLATNRPYLVYEFWSDRFLGAQTNGFAAELTGPDCGMYAVIAQENHPQLVSTSRHIRQMANDILDLAWNGPTRTLSGVSKIVPGDPYELRIHLPDGFKEERMELADGLTAETTRAGKILKVRCTPASWKNLEWSIRFQAKANNN